MVQNDSKEVLNMEYIIGLFSVLITVGGSLYIYKNKSHNEVAREQLETIYSPLLEILQKHLFKRKDSYETDSFIYACDKAKKLILENSLIFPFYIRGIFEEFLETADPEKKEKLFISFSNQLLNSYNDLCKVCHLPRIPVSYRIKHGLYKNKTIGIISEIWLWTQALYITILILMVGILLAFTVYKLLIYTGSQLHSFLSVTNH